MSSLDNKSVVDKLNSIRELMELGKNLENNDQAVFQLTEDDLLDEFDEDAHLNQIKNSKKKPKINELLTQFNHPLNDRDENLNAAINSVAYIKSLLKKAQASSNLESLDEERLSNIIQKTLEPIVMKWLEDNLASIVEKVLQDEFKIKRKDYS